MKNNNEIAFRKICKVLEFVWSSPYSSFYRDKYKKSGIDLLKDINSMEDFQKLPYLTREDLLKSDPFDRFYAPINKFKTYGTSSGTTSDDLVIILRSNKTNYHNRKRVKKALELGVKSCMIFRRPVIYLDSLEVRHKSINRYLANLCNLPSTAMLMSKLRVDSMVISPSTLNRLIPQLEKYYDLKKIKLVSLGGEYNSNGRLTYYKEKFPNAYFNIKYATTEIGGVGKSCQYLIRQSPQIFHPKTNLYYEFIEPEDGSELVVTHLDRLRELPLIRYKTGDRVKIYHEDCLCGTNEKIKVFGRMGVDVVGVGGIYVYPELIDDMVISMKDFLDISNWKLHIFDQFSKKLPKLQFQLILRKGIKNPNKAKELIRKAFIQKLTFDSQDNLENLVKQGKFSVLEVDFMDSIEPTLPKNTNIIYHGAQEKIKH